MRIFGFTIYGKHGEKNQLLSATEPMIVGNNLDIRVGNTTTVKSAIKDDACTAVKAEKEGSESNRNDVIKWLSDGLHTSFKAVGEESVMCAEVNLDLGNMKQKCLLCFDPISETPIKIIPVIPSGKALIEETGKKASALGLIEDSDSHGEYFALTTKIEGVFHEFKKKSMLEECDIRDFVNAIQAWADCLAEARRKAAKKNLSVERGTRTGGFSYSKGSCKRCSKIVISDRAYANILAEALSRDPVETGGILLGNIKGDIWYVVEATDPGIRTTHSRVHHEMDQDYHNHIYPVLSRLYKHDLILLGLWHRHPGTLNTFSMDDNTTNDAYSRAIGNGTLSFLLNFTPEPKLTCYYFDDGNTDQYYLPEVEIGDKHFQGTDFLELASEETLISRKQQMQEEMKQQTRNKNKAC